MNALEGSCERWDCVGIGACREVRRPKVGLDGFPTNEACSDKYEGIFSGVHQTTSQHETIICREYTSVGDGRS